MHDRLDPVARPDLPPDHPFRREPDAVALAMRAGLRESAEWYDLKGLTMVVGGPDGDVLHVPARRVLDTLDELDRHYDAALRGSTGAR